jgi:hypothetical protein
MDKQKTSLSLAIAIAALASLMAISFTASGLTANAQIPGVTPQQGGTDEQSLSSSQEQ